MPSENNTDEKKPKQENPDQAENHDDAPKDSEPEQEKPDQVKMKLSILLDTITTKKRAVHRFRAGGKSSHRRRRLALGRF